MPVRRPLGVPSSRIVALTQCSPRCARVHPQIPASGPRWLCTVDPKPTAAIRPRSSVTLTFSLEAVALRLHGSTTVRSLALPDQHPPIAHSSHPVSVVRDASVVYSQTADWRAVEWLVACDAGAGACCRCRSCSDTGASSRDANSCPRPCPRAQSRAYSSCSRPRSCSRPCPRAQGRAYSCSRPRSRAQGGAYSCSCSSSCSTSSRTQA